MTMEKQQNVFRSQQIKCLLMDIVLKISRMWKEVLSEANISCVFAVS